MNTTTIRRSVSLVASVLVSFALVELIANYAIPSATPQLLVQAESASQAPAPAPAPRSAR